MGKDNKGLTRHFLSGVMALLATVLAIAVITAKCVINNGAQVRQAPFHIAGNLYYVGTKKVTSFLLTGGSGHVLIDGGYPGTASMIMENIATLGFNISDVKILLNSHAHFDHAGGLAALQQASGAELWVSEADADIMATGGAMDPTIGALKFLVHAGLVKYPAPRVDHRFNNGTRICLGAIELTAHITAGHTRGCTSWSFPVRDGNRELLAVSIGELAPPLRAYLGEADCYPDIGTVYERNFKMLRSLPADIFLASDAEYFSMCRKLQERTTAKNAADPFIDRVGYLKHINMAEQRFRKMASEQEQERYWPDLQLH